MGEVRNEVLRLNRKLADLDVGIDKVGNHDQNLHRELPVLGLRRHHQSNTKGNEMNGVPFLEAESGSRQCLYIKVVGGQPEHLNGKSSLGQSGKICQYSGQL